MSFTQADREKLQQVDGLRLELRELRKRLELNQHRDEAMKRYATTGETAIPMTTEHVAVILGYTNRNSVNNYVAMGLLKRRYNLHTGFHPDDVRACLKQLETRRAREEAERQAVLQASA